MALEQLVRGEDCLEVDALLLNVVETFSLWHRVLESKFKKGDDVKSTRVVSG